MGLDIYLYTREQMHANQLCDAASEALYGRADYGSLSTEERIRRSWILTDPACSALALADAQVWATLWLARVTQRAATGAWGDPNA